MTEPGGPQIPPKPPLPPRELHREAAEGLAYHGHHVVDGEELEAVFEEPTAEQVKVRRRWTHGVVLSLLGGLVVAALAMAFLVWSGVVQFPPAGPASSSIRSAGDSNCPSDTFDYPANIGITVNVYNTTARAGLAGTLAAELKSRGYQVATVDNKTITTSSAGVVVAGLKGESAAFNLQRNVPGLEFRKDDRPDASVDVYLASGYQGPTPADTVDSAPGKITCSKAATSSGN